MESGSAPERRSSMRVAIKASTETSDTPKPKFDPPDFIDGDDENIDISYGSKPRPKTASKNAKRPSAKEEFTARLIGSFNKDGKKKTEKRPLTDNFEETVVPRKRSKTAPARAAPRKGQKARSKSTDPAALQASPKTSIEGRCATKETAVSNEPSRSTVYSSSQLPEPREGGNATKLDHEKANMIAEALLDRPVALDKAQPLSITQSFQTDQQTPEETISETLLDAHERTIAVPDSGESSPLSSAPPSPRDEGTADSAVPSECTGSIEIQPQLAGTNTSILAMAASTDTMGFDEPEAITAKDEETLEATGMQREQGKPGLLPEEPLGVENGCPAEYSHIVPRSEEAVPVLEKPAEAGIELLVPETPPVTDKTIQLPTPPPSINSSLGAGEQSPFLRTSSRHVKAPEMLGNFVNPVNVIYDLDQDNDTIIVTEPQELQNETPDRNGHKALKNAKTKRTRPQTASASVASKKKPASSDSARVTKAKKPEIKRDASKTKKAVEVTSGSMTIKLKQGAKASKKAAALPQSKPKPSRKVASQTGATTKTAVHKKVKEAKQLVATLPLPSKLLLSHKLTKRGRLEAGRLDRKPDPVRKPEVWAESRQALCETLSYFKKPQGGCYQNEGHVYAFLFDGVGHCREYMSEDVIISRAGGSMESDPTGGMVQRKDQTMKEAQVQAVLNDIAHRNPVVVICGNRNTAAPCLMPHQYCILGWYKPISVWSEKTSGKGAKVWTTIKYRFERLNRHEEPWHARESYRPSEAEKASAGHVTEAGCMACRVTFPQIYLQGWMCLNAECKRFWMLNGREAPHGSEGLDYHPAYLLHESALWKDGKEDREPEPTSLKPGIPNVGNAIGDNLAYINTRGICCSNCGRCNSRRKFNGWECETPGCGFTLFPEHRPVVPAMLHRPWDSAPTLVRNKHANGVHVHVENVRGFKVCTYTFEKIDGHGIEGRFIHMAATKDYLGRKNGPNEMFKAIQTANMGLERRTFAVKKMSGAKAENAAPKSSQVETADPQAVPEEAATADVTLSQVEPREDEEIAKKPEFEDGDLMTAFSMNYGMPYKFVANGASRSFDEAPWPVTECRRRLNWAQKEILNAPEGYMDFNEELIFAYLEGQKIEYHDDGEQGLGPRIATLSLGGRAKMHMRMKGKHFVGCTKGGMFVDEKPVPGSIDGEQMYRKRLQKWEELQKLKHDGPAYTKRKKEISKELGIYDKRTKKAEDLVTVTLSHGDIVIMDGYDIQKYLEHKVVPEGYLRFALTCRTVLPNHLKPGELPGYEVKEIAPEDEYKGPEFDEDINPDEEMKDSEENLTAA